MEKKAAFGSVDKGNARKDELERQNPVDDKEINKQKPEKPGNKESPYVFLSPDNPVVLEFSKTYGLSESFPRDLFLVRNDAKKDDFTNVYIVSEKVKQIVSSNCLKVVNSGVKLFKKQGNTDATFPYRISSEGVSTIASHLSDERRIEVNLEGLLVFIKHSYPKFSEFPIECKTKLEELNLGSCLLSYDPNSDVDYKGSLQNVIVLPFFRAHVSVSLLLDKAERRSLLHRLTGESIETFNGLEKEQ
jgi:hypothetical protein